MTQLISRSCHVIPFEKNIITGQECFIMKAQLFIIELNGLWYLTSIQVPAWRKTELGMCKFQYLVSTKLFFAMTLIKQFQFSECLFTTESQRPQGHSNCIPPNLSYSEPDQQCSAISLFPERGVMGYINHNITVISLLITSVREQNLFSLAV